MTYLETAESMRRVADAMERLATQKKIIHQSTGIEGPLLNPEQTVGAAGMLCFIRDLFTVSPREDYNRADILVLLETISRDQQLLPRGIGIAMWSEE